MAQLNNSRSRREGRCPDPDADAERKSYAERSAAFHADIKSHRDGGFVVDQVLVNDLAKRYGVATRAQLRVVRRLRHNVGAAAVSRAI